MFGVVFRVFCGYSLCFLRCCISYKLRVLVGIQCLLRMFMFCVFVGIQCFVRFRGYVGFCVFSVSCVFSAFLHNQCMLRLF